MHGAGSMVHSELLLLISVSWLLSTASGPCRLVTTVAAQPTAAAVPAAADVSTPRLPAATQPKSFACLLSIQGSRNRRARTAVQYAGMQCTGAASAGITIATSAEAQDLADQLQPYIDKNLFNGSIPVRSKESRAALDQACGQWDVEKPPLPGGGHQCMRLICSREPVVIQLSAHILDVDMAKVLRAGAADYEYDTAQENMPCGLCIGGYMTVQMLNSSFSGATMLTPVCARSNSTLSIRSSTFKDNINDMAGSIHVAETARLVVQDTVFSNNTANSTAIGWTGGVLASGNATVLLQHGTVFDSNAGTAGGAAAFYCYNCQVIISDTSFVNNAVTQYGGAITSYGAQLHIQRSVFRNNRATQQGGAVAVYGSDGYATNLTVSGRCQFVNNTAMDYGGAVVVGESAVALVGGPDTVFNANNAGKRGYGGAVYGMDNGTLNLAPGVLLTDNTAIYGGAMYTAGNARVVVSNGVKFISNLCPRETGGIGGAAAVDEQSILQFGGSESATGSRAVSADGMDEAHLAPALLRDNAAYNGGAIVALLNGTVVFNESSVTVMFDGNSAQHKGGAVYTMNNAQLHALAGVQVFTSNTAWFGGAAFASGYSLVKLDPSSTNGHTNTSRSVTIFKNNTAQYGGAVGADEDGLVNLGPGTMLHDNSASDSGGAAYSAIRGCVVLNSTTIDSCSSMRRGGAYFGEGVSKLAIEGHTRLVNCSTVQTGGAVALALNANLSMQGLGFVCKDSVAGTEGGCIHATDSTQIVVRSNFTAAIINCQARNNGGGVYLSTSAALTVESDSTLMLHSNVASQGSGGGIAALDTSSISLLSTNSDENMGFVNLPGSSVCSDAAGVAITTASSINTTSVTQLPGLGLLVVNNTCGSNGAGIALLDQSTLLYQLNSPLCIIANRADTSAGGLLLQGRISSYSGSNGGSNNDDSDSLATAAVAAAIWGNSAPIGNSDFSPLPDYLEVLEVLPDLSRFVSRQGRDEGVIQLSMRVTGRGFPVQGIQLQASRSDAAAVAAGDRILLGGSVSSDAAGVALFSSLKLQQKPGTYTITVSAPQYPDTSNLTRNFTVTVVPCTPGEVTGLSGDYCQTCPPGEYSFTPTSVSCGRCAERSESRCLGGALVMPVPGAWQPKPDSANMTRCPNPEACLGFPSDTCQVDNHTRQAFRACHPYCTSTYGDNRIANCSSMVECNGSCGMQTYMELQCAQGYEGQLCGVCSRGYGSKGVFQCNQCLDSRTIVVLYVVGAVILLLLVRTLAHLSETQNLLIVSQLAASTVVAGAGWRGASNQLSQLPVDTALPGHSGARRYSQPLVPEQQHGLELPDAGKCTASAAGEVTCSDDPEQTALDETPSRELGVAVIQSLHEQQQQQQQQQQIARGASSQIGRGLFEYLTLPFSRGSARSSFGQHAESAVPLEPHTAAQAAPAVHDVESSPGTKDQTQTAPSGAPSRLSSNTSAVAAPQPESSAAPKSSLTDNSNKFEQWLAQKLRRLKNKFYRSGIEQSKIISGSQLGTTARSLPSDVLRALVLYLQFWAILGSMRLTWPRVLAWPISALASLFATGSSVSMSVDCLIQTMGYTSQDAIALGRIVFHLATPFVMLAILLLFELVVWQVLQVASRFRRLRFKVAPLYLVARVRVSLLALATMQTFYPAVVRSCLSALVCVPIAEPDGVSYFWAGYLNQPCGRGWHAPLMWLLGVACTCLVCLGLPVFLFWKLMSNSHKPDSPLVLAQYGSMYRCYRLSPITRAWESVILLQTTVLVAISVFGYALGQYYQAILMNFTLTLGVVVILKIQPYQCRRLQRLVTAGAACLAVTTYAALTFLPGSAAMVGDSSMPASDSKSTLADDGREVIGTLVLALNAAFTCWGLYELVTAFDWQQVKALVKLVAGGCRTVVASMHKFAATSWEHGVVHPAHKDVEDA